MGGRRPRTTDAGDGSSRSHSHERSERDVPDGDGGRPGQIVLPKEACCDLQIAGDTVLVLVQRGNEIVLRKEEDVLRELGTGWQHLGRAALESAWDDEDEGWEDHHQGSGDQGASWGSRPSGGSAALADGLPPSTGHRGVMYEGRIEIDPQVQHGNPVIKGTRVAVHILVGSVAGGMGVDEVAEAYGVSAEDVKAALAYAADLV